MFIKFAPNEVTFASDFKKNSGCYFFLLSHNQFNLRNLSRPAMTFFVTMQQKVQKWRNPTILFDKHHITWTDVNINTARPSNKWQA
jgi:hypothetical protein